MNLEWISVPLSIYLLVLIALLRSLDSLINKINFYAKSLSHNKHHDNDIVERDDDDDDSGDVVWWTEPVLESTAESPTLPDELIVEILLRLPVRSLLQLRSVCNSWKTLISSPQFAKDHLQRSIADPTMTRQRLVSYTIDGDRHHSEFVSCPVQSLLEWTRAPARALKLRMRRGFKILGSCNGLLCLYDVFDGYVQLWNPSTRLRSERSPTVLSNPYRDITHHGFGYDHVHGKYKVLLVFDNSRERVTKVYTFGANSLTTIQDFPCRTTRWCGKFVSGTLNWLAREAVILSFDLGKETYGKLSLPARDDDSLCKPELGVLRNCLCVCFEDKKSPHWVVWLMKEYGVEHSWTKLVRIPHGELQFSGWAHYLEPLCIWENGFVLGTVVFFQLVLYNSNDSQLKYPIVGCRMGSERSRFESDLHTYHESLVSPC